MTVVVGIIIWIVFAFFVWAIVCCGHKGDN